MSVYAPVRECRRVFMERYAEQLCLTAEDIAPWLIDALSERAADETATLGGRIEDVDTARPLTALCAARSLNASTRLPGGDGAVDVASTPALRRNNPPQTEVASQTTAWARETTPEGV